MNYKRNNLKMTRQMISIDTESLELFNEMCEKLDMKKSQLLRKWIKENYNKLLIEKGE